MSATADTPLDIPPGGPPWPVVAYCAPGLKAYAERLLETTGDQATAIIEHPYMAGRTDVILTTSPDGPARAEQHLHR